MQSIALRNGIGTCLDPFFLFIFYGAIDYPNREKQEGLRYYNYYNTVGVEL